MNPDDQRHGTNAGYCAGCRDECCQRAHMVNMKRYRMNPKTLVPVIGTRRRIEALEAIGWSRAHVSRELGHSREWVGHVLRKDTIRQDTAAVIADIYERLSMVLPMDAPTRCKGQTRFHEVARSRARANGFAPPMAWDDDIDNPDAVPNFGGRDVEVDPIVVERLAAGHRTKSTQAEKFAAMEKWLAMGHSQRSLCAIHGWQESRYVVRQDGAA